jgi:hypothetical protein|tara:strand:- start:1847 stop:2332 length:486 start_codon:yes stop_codon:yes gene_type:complete
VEKKILTEISLYFGKVNMPKGFEIEPDILCDDILKSNQSNSEFPFSRNWDKLNTYITEHINLEHGIKLVNRKTWGDTFKSNETSQPLSKIDPVDFVLLYGVKTKNCSVRFHYNDNRRKIRSWNVELKDNCFILFPSNCLYYIKNNQKDSFNYIQTILYDYI